MVLNSVYTASQMTSAPIKALAIKINKSVMATVRSEDEFIHFFVVSSHREPTVTQSLGVSVQLCPTFRYTNNQKMCMICTIPLYSGDHESTPYG